MKKIMVMLLCIAATMNVLAVDYTAKAKVTLTAESSYTCDLMISESAEFGDLSGSVMNMEGRVVALYGLNGETKLQIVKASNLNNVKLGLMADVSTNYTLTVSSVEGSVTLYIHDNEENTDYALTEGAVYYITVDNPSTTDEERFYLKKKPVELDVCFRYNKLEINANPYSTGIVIKDAEGNEITGSPFNDNLPYIDLSGFPKGQYSVEFNEGEKKFIVSVL